jgi:hypothetical protein
MIQQTEATIPILCQPFRCMFAPHRAAPSIASLVWYRQPPPAQAVQDGKLRSATAQQLRQLGDVYGDAPGLIAGEDLSQSFKARYFDHHLLTTSR